MERRNMSFDTMIDGPKGAFGAYIAKPAQPNGAALVVIQEIFGVNDVMRALADAYAAQGYLAIVPDLFWRIQPGISITDKTPEDWALAFDYYGKFDVAGGVEDIQATITYAKTQANKIGAVGYCLGGLLAYLTACQTDIDASVSFYGVGIDQQADSAKGIKNPLLLHVAAEDQFVSKEAQLVIKEIAAAHALMTVHVYEGLDHAFARPGGDHFDAAGAKLANDRTSAFFKQSLV
jgi:carboxymethylenebutenolidase